MSKYKYKYKRIDPILKMKPHCCRCAIILSNTEPYNTSTIDPQWCDECYQKRLLSNLSLNKENEKRDFIYCLDKNCDGYKGGLWVDKLKQDDTHNAFICPDCCKLIPVVNINVERNLLIKENENNA